MNLMEFPKHCGCIEDSEILDLMKSDFETMTCCYRLLEEVAILESAIINKVKCGTFKIEVSNKHDPSILIELMDKCNRIVQVYGVSVTIKSDYKDKKTLVIEFTK